MVSSLQQNGDYFILFGEYCFGNLRLFLNHHSVRNGDKNVLGESTLTALHDFTNEVLLGLESLSKMMGILCDLSKAHVSLKRPLDFTP